MGRGKAYKLKPSSQYSILLINWLGKSNRKGSSDLLLIKPIEPDYNVEKRHK